MGPWTAESRLGSGRLQGDPKASNASRMSIMESIRVLAYPLPP